MRLLKLGLSEDRGFGGGFRRVAGLGLLPALTLFAGAAQASGPVEALVGVQVDPENAQRLVLRYDNTGTKTGLIYSADGGKSFDLLCTSAMAEDAIRALDMPSKAHVADIRASLTRARNVLVLGGGRTLVGTTGGLFVDNGKGCAFRDVPELSTFWIAGMATSAQAPKVSYVITNGTTGHPNEGLWRRDESGALTQLWQSPEVPTGENWSNAGLVVGEKPGGGLRLITSTSRLRKVGDTYVYSIFALKSDDGGESFEERAITVPERAAFTLLGIDPTNGDRVLGLFERVREGGSLDENRDTLLLSTDGGLSFSTLYEEVSSFASAVFAPDGTLWVADNGSKSSEADALPGLLRFEKGLEQAPTRVLDSAVACIGLTADPNELLLCKRLELGRFDVAAAEFTALVDMSSVDRIQACPGQDVVADCHDQLCAPGWCGPGHFASAPLCSAYDEPFCGNDADNYNSRRDAGTTGSDAGADGGTEDAGKPDQCDADAGPCDGSDAGVAAGVKKKDDCSIHPGSDESGHSPAAWLLTSIVGALLIRRGNRKRA